MNQSHPATLSESQLLAECQVRRQRRSGPGGQHRNKVETAVVMVHQPTGVKGEATERRSQAQNRARALFRLRTNLALALRSPVGEPSPSALWQSRCRSGKIVINPSHEDFPSLLAEALDVLEQEGMQVKPAAQRLECSSSQLIKFLQLEPRALEQVNRRRVELRLKRLR